MSLLMSIARWAPIAQAIKLGEPRVINNIRSDDTFSPWRDEAMARGYFSMVAMPVVLKGQVVAVLSLYSGMENDFDHRMLGSAHRYLQRYNARPEAHRR